MMSPSTGEPTVPKLWIVPAFAPPGNVKAGEPASLKSPSKYPDVPFATLPSLPAEEKYRPPEAVTTFTACARMPS